MKEEHTASRTLVKSAPELWAECSVAASLTRHLGQFGEIVITRLEPETAVAWEGERASGTVRLEPSGWGTQVTLIARATAVEAVPTPEQAADEVLEEEQHEEVVEEPELEAVEPEPEPDPVPRAAEPEPLAVQPQPKGLFARLRGLFGGAPAPVVQAPPEPRVAMRPVEPESESEPEPEPEAEPEVRAVRRPTGAPGPPEVEPVVQARPKPIAVAPPPPAADDPDAVLAAALDSLGQAHHRPFSRA